MYAVDEFSMGNYFGRKRYTKHSTTVISVPTKKKVNANKLCDTKKKVKFELNNANSISNVKHISLNCTAQNVRLDSHRAHSNWNILRDYEYKYRCPK